MIFGTYGLDFGAGYVDGGSEEKTAKQYMDECYKAWYPVNASYWQQGLIDKRFKVGDQSLYSSIYGEQEFQRHKRFFFNKIRKHCNMICGYQRRNRKGLQTVSIENETNGLSDQFTKALKYIERESMFQDAFSKGCEGATDVGVDYMHLYMDYSQSPIEGRFAWDNVAYNNCLVDPHFRKADFSDCNGWWRRRWMTHQEIVTMHPEREKDISRIRQGGADGRFQLQAELANRTINNLLPYDEFYYRSTRKATMVCNRQTGDVYEYRGDKDDLKEKLQPWEIIKKVDKSCVNLTICVGSKVIYDGINLMGTDRWPVVPVLGYYEPDIPNFSSRLMGVVRNLRDAQYLYNRRKIIELSILESVANSGFIFNVDSVTDQKAFRQTGEGVLIPVKKGVDVNTAIRQIQPPAVPQSMIELSRALSDDITDISGVNEELMGSATDDKAGVLAMLRQGAGLTTLQTLYDQWDFAQQLCGQLQLEAMQRNWSAAKSERVLGEQPIDGFFNVELARYEVSVIEGVYSSTQRSVEAQQLMYLRNTLEMPIPDKTIIRALQIQNKDELINDIEEQNKQQAEQQQQQMQQQSEMQMAELEMKAQLNQSKIALDMASAQEKKASVVQGAADMAVKLSGAEKAEAQADLALVKQLVELDSLSIESLNRSLALAQQIRQESEDKILPQNIIGTPEVYDEIR